MALNCANSMFNNIGRKDDLAAKAATPKRAALDRVIDLLSIDPELAGEFGRGQIAPPGTLEFGEQVWRLLSQHLDDCVPLPAFLAPQLHDGAAIKLRSDFIGIGRGAITNPASDQHNDRAAERLTLRGIVRARLSQGSVPIS